jgi:hypothetical protein
VTRLTRFVLDRKRLILLEDYVRAVSITASVPARGSR